VYDYLNGKLALKSPAHAVLDVGGVGYHVHISLTTYAQIKDLESCKLYVSLQVREDAHTLYGFATEAERRLFGHLISVAGIGPNTGRMMLSSSTPEEIRSAIVGGQVPAIQRIKGIGPKTAQRVILELQDKLRKENPDEGSVASSPAKQSVAEEAGSALVMLGFGRPQVDKVLAGLLAGDAGQSVEELIKAALKKL